MWKAFEVGSVLLPWKLSSSYRCNFLFQFWSKNENFAPELCYNLMHFRNLHRGVAFNVDILSTKQSINLTFVCFLNLRINKTNVE